MTKKEALESLITNMARQLRSESDYEIPAGHRKSTATLIDFLGKSFSYDMETGLLTWNFPTEDEES